MKGRNYLSCNLQVDSPLHDVYMQHLLETIISAGDVQVQHSKQEDMMKVAFEQIAQLLQPLALLLSTSQSGLDKNLTEDKLSLMRDAWFNIVVHGFASDKGRGDAHLNELRVMAMHSRPLVTEQRGEQAESDIELNTVLRRGMSAHHEETQKEILKENLPSRHPEIKAMSYRKVIFLQAAYFVETLRAETGDCTKALYYYLEPSMRKGEMCSTMDAITTVVMDTYLRKAMSGLHPTFSASHVADQLVAIFMSCCYRIERVQQAAVLCADRIIHDIPSALCQRSSLFALLELLSLLWKSCLESETEEYEWKSSLTSAKGQVTVELSDNHDLRRRTLNTLYKKAKAWVTSALNYSPLDIKGLLQTYLSEYEDDGAYGHIQLGRSFATEMGTMIPDADSRLGTINRHGLALDVALNTASDFVAQYTTRQEYRFAEALPDHSVEWQQFMHKGDRSSLYSDTGKEDEDAATMLAHLNARVSERKHVAIGEVRDILRRAAALLCRSHADECAIVHHLVAIPFAIFTKQSIALGISLWLGVMNENPRMEPRILMEITHQWEGTIQRRLGVFNTSSVYVKIQSMVKTLLILTVTSIRSISKRNLLRVIERHSQSVNKRPTTWSHLTCVFYNFSQVITMLLVLAVGTRKKRSFDSSTRR